MWSRNLLYQEGKFRFQLDHTPALEALYIYKTYIGSWHMYWFVRPVSIGSHSCTPGAVNLHKMYWFLTYVLVRVRYLLVRDIFRETYILVRDICTGSWHIYWFVTSCIGLCDTCIGSWDTCIGSWQILSHTPGLSFSLDLLSDGEPIYTRENWYANLGLPWKRVWYEREILVYHTIGIIGWLRLWAPLNFKFLLQNIVSFIGLFYKRDL